MAPAQSGSRAACLSASRSSRTQACWCCIPPREASSGRHFVQNGPQRAARCRWALHARSVRPLGRRACRHGGPALVRRDQHGFLGGVIPPLARSFATASATAEQAVSTCSCAPESLPPREIPIRHEKRTAAVHPYVPTCLGARRPEAKPAGRGIWSHALGRFATGTPVRPAPGAPLLCGLANARPGAEFASISSCRASLPAERRDPPRATRLLHTTLLARATPRRCGNRIATHSRRCGDDAVRACAGCSLRFDCGSPDGGGPSSPSSEAPARAR